MVIILSSFYSMYNFTYLYLINFLYIYVDTKVNVSISAYVVLAHLHC